MNLPELGNFDFKFIQETDKKTSGFYDEIRQSVGKIISLIERPFQFPPNIKVTNLTDLEKYFNQISQQLLQINKIKIPKQEDISIKSLTTIIKSFQDKIDELKEVISETKVNEVNFPKTFSIDNFPPQMTPQPVTNININSLRGIAHTTSATVTASLTPLPTYGVLDNRRSLIIYNNDSSSTVYIGGSDVTASNGYPVLAGTSSPPIDAGPLMVIYGVTSSGSVNVRILEASSDPTGS